MPDPASVRVPATSANLGAGFDCLGMALDLWSVVSVSEGGSGDETLRPAQDEPMAHMALTAARRVFETANLSAPVLQARYEGEIPIARGLGASAVARVGGLVAGNELAGRPLTGDDLLTLGAELEGHADNVAPALFGGLQVCVVEEGRVLHAEVPVPAELRAVLFVPELRMPTKESRRLLPGSLSRADAVHNSSRTALLVAAVVSGRFDLLDTATDDRLHQPARSQLFPAMYDIFRAAKGAGAHCAYLSGGGSTICALATENEEQVADAMRQAAEERETAGVTIITRPTNSGARIVA